MNVLLMCSLFVIISCSSCLASLKFELDTVYKWKYIDYVWLSEEHKKAAIANGEYDYEKAIPMDFDIAPGTNTFFIFWFNLKF